jgi:transposase-like protein
VRHAAATESDRAAGIDVPLSQRRDLAAARRFFTRALRAGTDPAEVTTDRAPVYPRFWTS